MRDARWGGQSGTQSEWDAHSEQIDMVKEIKQRAYSVVDRGRVERSDRVRNPKRIQEKVVCGWPESLEVGVREVCVCVCACVSAAACDLALRVWVC